MWTFTQELKTVDCSYSVSGHLVSLINTSYGDTVLHLKQIFKIGQVDPMLIALIAFHCQHG